MPGRGFRGGSGGRRSFSGRSRAGRQEQWSIAVDVALGKTFGKLPVFREGRRHLLDLQLQWKAHLHRLHQQP